MPLPQRHTRTLTGAEAPMAIKSRGSYTHAERHPWCRHRDTHVCVHKNGNTFKRTVQQFPMSQQSTEGKDPALLLLFVEQGSLASREFAEDP